MPALVEVAYEEPYWVARCADCNHTTRWINADRARWAAQHHLGRCSVADSPRPAKRRRSNKK